MNNQEFKKLLRESIESGGENWINEAPVSNEREKRKRVNLSNQYNAALNYAWFLYHKREDGNIRATSPGLSDNEIANILKGEFKKTIREFGMPAGNIPPRRESGALNKWKEIYNNYNKKWRPRVFPLLVAPLIPFSTGSQPPKYPDALARWFFKKLKEKRGEGENLEKQREKYKESFKYALVKYTDEHEEEFFDDFPDSDDREDAIKERFRQDMDDLNIDPQSDSFLTDWKEIYDTYHKNDISPPGAPRGHPGVSDAIHNYVLKKRGYEDESSKEEFRSKGIGKELEPKLQKAIENIKQAATTTAMSADKFEILLRYYALGRSYKKPKNMKSFLLDPGAYGLWVEETFRLLAAKDKQATIQSFIEEMMESIKKSPLYTQPHKLLTVLLKKDKLQILNLINDVLDNMDKLKIGGSLKQKINQMIAAGTRARARMSEQEELSEE